jgi:hypothetical protein
MSGAAPSQIGWYILDASIRALTGKAYSKSINILGGALTIGGFVVKYTLVLGRTANSRGLGFTAAAVCGIVILVIAYQRVVLPRMYAAATMERSMTTPELLAHRFTFELFPQLRCIGCGEGDLHCLHQPDHHGGACAPCGPGLVYSLTFARALW